LAVEPVEGSVSTCVRNAPDAFWTALEKETAEGASSIHWPLLERNWKLHIIQ
jgi:hypothetical protein